MTTAALGENDAPAASRTRVTLRQGAMGGRLEIHVAVGMGAAAAAEIELERVARRVRAWSAILTRHDPRSRLMRLNDDPRAVVSVGPTVAAVLAWAAEADALTGGTVDVALLDARLAAELGDEAAAGAGAVGIAGTSGAAANPGGVRAAGRGAWSLTVGRHRSGVVARPPGLRFDLDGVGKGWIADRALAVLGPAGAIVDADGDIAVRAAPGDAWEVAVGDPRDDTRALAVLALPGGPFGRSFGVASSGTSVHHWGPAGARRHHLIDPATGAPARTDVVQATVIATTAREAEAYAKAIVIRGAAAGLDLVERSGAGGAIVLLEDGRTVALPRTTRYLA